MIIIMTRLTKDELQILMQVLNEVSVPVKQSSQLLVLIDKMKKMTLDVDGTKEEIAPEKK